jgi:hypothetical protein
VLLTGGRSARYHTPEDVPEALDFARMEATVRWLERFVRASCARPDAPFAFVDARNDVLTLESLIALTSALAPVSPLAEVGLAQARTLRAACRADATLPAGMRGQLEMLVGALEQGLA